MARAIASSIETTKHLTDFLDTFIAVLGQNDIGAVLVQFPDYCPSAALPLLAQQYDVLGYKGYELATTDSQKRQLIKNAIALHKTKGTPFAIKNAIISLGFDKVVIREGTGILYNGAFNFDGTHNYVGGNWYDFSVQVFYSGAAPDTPTIALINNLIDVYKNTRSILFALTFTLTTP